MDENLDMLYQYWIGTPDPIHWEAEISHTPMLGHGFYCFCQGLRLGFSLGCLTAEETLPPLD